MPWHPLVPGLFDSAYENAAQVAELIAYGPHVGLSESQAREVIRVTWAHYCDRGFSFDVVVPEIRNNMVKWSFGERWRP